MKIIKYETRLLSNDSKLASVPFDGALDISPRAEDVLISHNLQVRVTPRGVAVFVDGHGREVSLCLVINPASTARGKKALEEYRENARSVAQSRQELEEEVERLMAETPIEEVIRRLRN